MVIDFGVCYRSNISFFLFSGQFKNDSLSSLLMQCLTSITITRSYRKKTLWYRQYNTVDYTYWKDKQNQRKFFDQLATSLKIQDWTTVSLNTILENGGYFVNSFYNGSVSKGM
jgi:hypothetical protein